MRSVNLISDVILYILFSSSLWLIHSGAFHSILCSMMLRRANKHTHTNQKAATDQDSNHNHQVHRKLHPGTQSNIYKSHILTTSIQNWRSTRWRPFTNTMQHLHCRHTTTRVPVQVLAYADDITITSIRTSTSAAKKFIQPYLHKNIALTKQNNLILYPDKTTFTLFITDPAEYKRNLYLKINNAALPKATHPKVLGLP